MAAPNLGKGRSRRYWGGGLVPALGGSSRGSSSADGSFFSLFPLIVKGPWRVPSHGAYTVCVQVKVHQRVALSPPLVLTLQAGIPESGRTRSCYPSPQPHPCSPRALSRSLRAAPALRPPALRGGWDRGSGWGRAGAMGSAWGQLTPHEASGKVLNLSEPQLPHP